MHVFVPLQFVLWNGFRPWVHKPAICRKLYFGDRSRFLTASYKAPGQQICEQTECCLGYYMQTGRFTVACHDAAVDSSPLTAGEKPIPKAVWYSRLSPITPQHPSQR